MKQYPEPPSTPLKLRQFTRAEIKQIHYDLEWITSTDAVIYIDQLKEFVDEQKMDSHALIVIARIANCLNVRVCQVCDARSPVSFESTKLDEWLQKYHAHPHESLKRILPPSPIKCRE